MALLTVEDDAFWEGSEPVTFGDLPQLQDPVTVVGVSEGEDFLSEDGERARMLIVEGGWGGSCAFDGSTGIRDGLLVVLVAILWLSIWRRLCTCVR